MNNVIKSTKNFSSYDVSIHTRNLRPIYRRKSTRDRTICAFIPAILLNLSLRHCDSTFLFCDLQLFEFMSR